MNKFKSRKLWMAIYYIAVSTIALFVGKLAGSDWVTLAIFIMGLYYGANVAGKKWGNDE